MDAAYQKRQARIQKKLAAAYEAVMAEEKGDRVDKRRKLRHYEIEDVAYHMVKDVERLASREHRKVADAASWKWLKTFKFGGNRLSLFEDAENDDMRHIVVSGGKHNVNLNFEDYHDYKRFILGLLEASGFRISKKGGYARVYIPSKKLAKKLAKFYRE